MGGIYSGLQFVSYCLYGCFFITQMMVIFEMNNQLLIIIILALLAGSGLLAADNKGAIKKFCENIVGEAVERTRGSLPELPQ